MSDLIIYGGDSTTARNLSLAKQLTLLKVDVSSLRDLGKGLGTGALIPSLEKLIEVIFSLRSLVNDSSPDQLLQTNPEINSYSPSVATEPPFYPEERLIPYVTEELGDIWNHFFEHRQKTPGKSPHQYENLSDQTPSEIVTLGDLQSLLLWRLGCSAENIMALLTGIEVMVTSPQGTRNRGVLRLVASLILKTPQGQYDLDLATGESSKFNLHHSAIVQSFDCDLCNVPRSAKSLLDQLKNIINQEFEALDLWKSQSIAVLEPGYNWEPGQLLLEFGFELVVNHAAMDWGENQVNEVNYPWSANSLEEEMTAPILLASQIKLTDIMIFRTNFKAKISQKIATPLENFCLMYDDFNGGDVAEKISVSEGQSRRVSSPKTKLSADIFNRFLIRKAWDLVEAIASESQDNRQSSPHRYMMIPQVSLGQLSKSLMWHTVRGSAAIARLIGGITVRVLEPGKLWYKGTVRLVAILSADFPGYHWEIDIATRESPRLIGTILDETAVIDWQPDPGVDNGGLASVIDTPSQVQCLGSQRFQQVGICSSAIITQLRDVSPELGIWIDGVEIDWEEPMVTESIWRSGLAQLVLAWELVK
ncbi:MAG: hypothetical protein EA414_02290 [Arthrospira sp. PLM2.Bin9]|nr:hypothetical protein [Arthrospira sp. PLM2.Bin9]TVU55333.1 MAG: hypothetical protein EA414_02290 [Arthrospira sp. PLM2.Bin9]